MFTPENLFGQILFGSIGLAAFVYGKKSALVRPMIIGVAIMAYPYFIESTLLLYLIGAALTASLFLFRE